MSRKLVFLVVIAALMLVPLSVSADGPGEGKGGLIVEGNLGGTVNFCGFNPLRCGDTATQRINSLMYPTLVGASPFTQTFGKIGEEGVTQALAVDWSVSEDGTIYTYKLRDDALWSDGTPITATDVKFSFDAIASGVIDSPNYGTNNYVPEGNEAGIKEIRIIDDFTVEVEYGTASCRALANAGFNVIPAHVFDYDGSADFDFSVMVGHEFDTAPSVAYGPFQFASFNPGEAIGLKVLPNWTENVVLPAGYVYRDVPDQNVAVEQFLAGESNYIDGPAPSRRADIRADGNVNQSTFAGNAWDFMAMNMADPDNPQPGLDADGNPIEQGHHPIFGDVRVRRAIQLGINVADIVQGAYFGEGTQMASYLIPTSWATDPNLAPIGYDPEAAGALLDEAGWPMGDDGVRVCQGCLYAKEGSPMEFELITNSGNVRREAIGVIVQDQLSELGIVVDFQAIDFDTAIDLTFGAQTFDAMILGWRNSFPDDPDVTQLFTPGSDDPANQGGNLTSYNNPEFTRLNAEALQVPGCDETKRAEIYYQMQKIIQDDQPYVWLSVQNTMYATQNSIEGFAPEPNQPIWNMSMWYVKEK